MIKFIDYSKCREKRVRLLNEKFYTKRTHFLAKKTYQCGRNLKGSFWVGNCIICDAYKESNWDTQFGPIERNFYHAIDKSDQSLPKVLAVGKTLQRKMFSFILGDDKKRIKSLGNVAHPEHGRDFLIIQEKITHAGRVFPNYDQSYFDEPSSLESNIYEYWMNNLSDFSDLDVPFDKDEVEAVLESFNIFPLKRKKSKYNSIDNEWMK